MDYITLRCAHGLGSETPFPSSLFQSFLPVFSRLLPYSHAPCPLPSRQCLPSLVPRPSRLSALPRPLRRVRCRFGNAAKYSGERGIPTLTEPRSCLHSRCTRARETHKLKQCTGCYCRHSTPMYPAKMKAHAGVLRVVQLFVLLLAVQLDAFALSSAGRVNGGGGQSSQAASLTGRRAAVDSSWRAAHPGIYPEPRPKIPLTVQTMSGGGADGQVCIQALQSAIVPGMAGLMSLRIRGR